MGEGFSRPVFWFLVCAFLSGAALSAAWFWLCFRDFLLYDLDLVAGRFSREDFFRITLLLSVWVAASSRLLMIHYRRVHSYSSPGEILFTVFFGFFLFIAIVCSLPALFSG
ncbi:MAG: hypothetical protein IN808_10665, partial [Rubrobacter sp.]|nr:hypothetical protein [Rubrobacter sp.]